MALKRYFTFPRFPELESHHPMQFNVIPKTLFFFFFFFFGVRLLPLCKGYTEHILSLADRAVSRGSVYKICTE